MRKSISLGAVALRKFKNRKNSYFQKLVSKKGHHFCFAPKTDE